MTSVFSVRRAADGREAGGVKKADGRGGWGREEGREEWRVGGVKR